MIEIPRDIFKTDPVFGQLYEGIKRNHKVAEHTKKSLIENKHIQGFTEESRVFVMVGNIDPIFIHYDAHSQYRENDHVVVRIESIGIYDNFMEYESARMKELHSTKGADIPNIN
jgi:hypothetical protein